MASAPHVRARPERPLPAVPAAPRRARDRGRGSSARVLAAPRSAPAPARRARVAPPGRRRARRPAGAVEREHLQPRSRSRAAFSRARASSSPTSSACMPSSSSTSIQSSSAASRSSSRRRPRSERTTRRRGRPAARHATAVGPRAAARHAHAAPRAPPARRSNRRTSIASGPCGRRSRGARLERVGSERRLAQARDAVLHVRRRSTRRGLPPELLDQRVDRDDLVAWISSSASSALLQPLTAGLRRPATAPAARGGEIRPLPLTQEVCRR